MTLGTRDRRALVLGGAALALIAVYVYGVEPLWARHDALLAKHEACAGRIARFRSDQAKADYYVRQVEQWETEVGGLTAPELYGRQLSVVTEKIITAAQANGTELKGLSPAAPALWPDDPKLQRAAVLIDAEAPWPDVFKFIGTLYRTEGVLSVEQMELTGDPKKGDKLTVKLNVSVLVLAPEDDTGGWSR